MQERRYEMGGRKIRGLKARMGWEYCGSRGKPDGPGSTVEVYKLEGSKRKTQSSLVWDLPKEHGGQLQSESCLEF